MAELKGLLAPRPRPTDEQHLAADPECSVWVSASAGTGKTRVLANRLLRLLLHGTDPPHILCLTYTKAGAAEMARRVQDDLARFAVLKAELLAAELEGLLGRPATADETARARTGLAGVLDLPAGLRIMTIHSFCQSLLHRFPLEARVSPHFELVEPRAAAALLEGARDDVLTSREPVVRQAVTKLAVALGEHSLGDALAELAAKRIRLQRLLADYGTLEAVIAKICRALGVEPGTTPDTIGRAVCSDPAIDQDGLSAASSALETGSPTDQAAARVIRDWLEAPVDRRFRRLTAYRLVYLTQQAVARKNLLTKDVDERFPHVAPILDAEQARLRAAVERQKAAVVAERTAALLRVGAAIIEAYERQKRAAGQLDYADLIEESRSLLAEPDAGHWVRYKLDQQIDHLLIDESQDTSPDQWAIVEALVDDFFSGDSGRQTPPTLFVVGDEKQSIFGFQGADVDTFQRLRSSFGRRAGAAGLAWREAPLARSFRSAPALLAAVDAVFADPGVRAGVSSAAEPMRHLAYHDRAAGLVEVWPLIACRDKPRTEPWQLPDQAEPVDPIEQRLARAITRQILVWRAEQTCLRDRDGAARPIRPGDIMILLPRRGIVQDLLVRELKKQHVPVAGADRIALTDELAVMDLMALGDALLLPEDDLTVAALLRSPLFGLSDDDLFQLAYERGDRPLHRRLGDLRDERAVFARADDLFRDLLAKADFVPPYEMYARFLGEGGGRRRLLARLGTAAALAIEAFLAQALAYERSHPPSLQGFLHWLRAANDDIKRDANEAGDEVRVLTVHGSKGLEAPIVFLADTTYCPDLGRDRLLWLDDGLPLWKMAGSGREAVSQAAYDRQRRRLEEEHRRLLYVAMTRAEQRLIVAGWQRKTARPGTWHDLISAGMARLSGGSAVEIDLGGGDRGRGWRFGDLVSVAAPSLQGELPLALDGRPETPALPSWLTRPGPGETAPAALRASFDPASEDPPGASSLGNDAQRRFGRGLLIHHLLQILPDHPPAARSSVLARYLARPGLNLDGDTRDEIAARITAILETPGWAPLFGPESRAEVPLIGEVHGRRVNGQVDRLVVLEDEVLVIDYKSNRPPPRQPSGIPAAYCRQMAIYRMLLVTIYPGRSVRSALLWTEGPELMMLDDRLLGRFEPASGRP